MIQSSRLKKGTGSEPRSERTGENNGREVPVPLLQRAASRRKFVKQCVTIGGGALCVPLLPGVLQASPDSSGTLQSREAVCPKSAPPAKTMWALRIEDLKQGSEERLPLSCLQGLVNRRQPQIFLAYDRFDVQWLDWLRERGDVNEVRWVGPKELYEKFLPVVHGPGGYRSGPARQRQRGDDVGRGRRLAAGHSPSACGVSAPVPRIR